MNEEPNAIKVRVKNVPLSADNVQIIRTLETSDSKCKNNDHTDNNDRSFQESDVYSQRSTKPLLSTEDRSRSDSDTEHSQLILGTQESKSSGNEKVKNVRSVDRRPGISRYLTTKPSHDQNNTTNRTPKQSKTRTQNIEKSPVTPTENLHDVTRDEAAKKPKKETLI
ncbi:unnamed protein product [Mytilus coruscus]|uniref:Uncharacterized protein n=1 Tax=Mytilus coruscus TaxID=42192 RepID=A0A6J8AHL7_MYTCO|nr:unnamed protein product [Mytilus coruscus]